ncbi:MAG: GTP cyclohydrolase IIa [Halobacteriales archaeon]
MALVQIDEYGPWTVTPAPKRETDLQALQAELFADFAEFAGERDGYAFYGRFDNMVAVTNGRDPESHRRFQRRVRNSSPVTVSVGVGRAETPVAALGAASEQVQAAGSAQSADRREAFGVADEAPAGSERVTVAHFDVVDVTGSLTDRANAVDATLAVQEATLELARHLRAEHDSVAHFVGGDNVIAICPDLDAGAFDEAVSHVREAAGTELQVGVGRARTAHAAGDEAKAALEVCRETGTRVQGVDRVAADD